MLRVVKSLKDNLHSLDTLAFLKVWSAVFELWKLQLLLPPSHGFIRICRRPCHELSDNRIDIGLNIDLDIPKIDFDVLDLGFDTNLYISISIYRES